MKSDTSPRLVGLLFSAAILLCAGCSTDLDVDGNTYACNTSDDCRAGYSCVDVPDKPRRECRLSTDPSDSGDVVDAQEDTSTDVTEDADTQTDVADTTDTADGDTQPPNDTDDVSEDAAETENSNETCSDGLDNDSDGNSDCRDDECLEFIVCARHVAFVTRADVSGDINGQGLTGATEICQREARDANRTEPGWKAMLSEKDLPIQEAITIEGPVWLPNDTLLATKESNFWRSLRAPLAIHADGSQLLSNPGAWTGMDADQNNLGDLCGEEQSWSSNRQVDRGHIGNTDKTDGLWYSSNVSAPCDRTQKLYCISGQ